MARRHQGQVVTDWSTALTAEHLRHFLRFFLFGQGEVAPVTREVLREAERDRARRPRVHAG
ncbi:hypothetical protein [Streptomyces sp. 11x1]|uniref:hypothetical protein n=1 Tax=Streptomyces sp. 11x1 TaxID=3038642 RepID=UPI00292E67C6|nr:hypothetical protein [Streptomyces sp. 11x1]WNZ07769.1 hypothetical protein P8T65_09360 [Streptomyces sp. 11x1]